jgi:asparagine synthase (glutamine-hydrolysing)
VEAGAERHGLEAAVHGRCAAAETEVAAAFLKGGAVEAGKLPGDFAAHLRRGSEEWVVSSPVGIFPYFYAESGGRFFHGPSVQVVTGKAGMMWSWDWEALGDLACLDQLWGDRTLCAGVRRFPPASALILKDGRGRLEGYRHEDPLSGEPSRGSSPERALQTFNAAVARDLDGEPVLSASGGLDSRVVLGSLLGMGAKPLLLVMGPPQGSDAVVSRLMSEELGLELLRVELRPPDFPLHAARISRLTGGAKTARHWHTYIYSVKAGLPGLRPFFVGINGAFAKGYYLDYGMPLRLLNFRSRLLCESVLACKSKSPFSGEEAIRWLRPELAEQLTPQAARARAERMAASFQHGLLDSLQAHFYLERTGNFSSYGLVLYGATVSWRAPFLDRGWMREAWGLERAWKLGGAWHRYALYHNFPRLLDFPNTTYLERSTPARPPRLYRRPWRRYLHPRVPYVDYPSLFAHPEVVAYLESGAKQLDDLIEEGFFRRIIDEHRARRNRTGALSLLMSLCALKEGLEEGRGAG